MTSNSKVGIIANPASGKDIRRLVAYGTVFDNFEKLNIVQRLILGVQSAGVDEILIMPDSFHFGRKAVSKIGKLDVLVSILDMSFNATQDDSTKAGRLLTEENAGCIIVLGGDGTNRAVAKGCGAHIPLMPVSTGTNNVFPYFMEGTVAGVAAGVIANGTVPVEEACVRTKRLNVLKDGEPIDLALIDAVVTDDVFVGSRALWDMSKIKQIVTTRGNPNSIGMSSVVGNFNPIEVEDNKGISIITNNSSLQPKLSVIAPVAPGVIDKVEIEEFEILNINDKVEVLHKPSVVALDGEREVLACEHDFIEIQLTKNGPLRVDIDKALRYAVKKEFFCDYM